MSSTVADFVQRPPVLGNQFLDDRVLRSALRRALPDEVYRDIQGELGELGALAGDELYSSQLADRLNEPSWTPWSAWGERLDRIDVTPLWRRAEELAVRFGLVATAYERRHGRFSRLDQFTRAYLFTPSTDIYSCPLAMTDGAARALLTADNQELIERVVPRLLSRDPATFWTSGQWMTETSGGSDVGRSLTEARCEAGTWRLYGRKWFTSAIASPMALTLARPKGNGPGGRGLALFYLETRDAQGLPNGIQVLRLKDKLGTRKVPTAELALDGAVALPVAGLQDGVRHMAPMLNITRFWNAVSATSLMRRGVALARSYARRREVFGSLLAEKPLHLETLAGLQAEFEGAFHLTFRLAELLGRIEGEKPDGAETLLLRVLTPIAKLVTAKQAVAVSSEVLEAFGGAGYVEDTGLPQLLRDAQVLPIWEGTTNVLALDVLRVLGQEGGFAALEQEVARCLDPLRANELERPAETVRQALVHAASWFATAAGEGEKALEAGARGFALTLGRSLELALLLAHAQWSLERQGDGRAAAAARRLAAHGVDEIRPLASRDAAALARDEPLLE